MTLFCKDWLLQQHNVCLLFGLGGLLVNPIVDVGDRLVKGCFGGFAVFGIYRLTISAPNGQSASLAILNDCNPNGIPIMVMQLSTPAPR